MSEHDIRVQPGPGGVCPRFGLREREEVTREHEREWDRTWTETVWMKGGRYLISEEYVSEALARELIRIAGELR